jgi:hypothetical protein
MRAEPSLKVIMNIREGASVDHHQIKSLSENFSDSTVIVNWIQLLGGYTAILLTTVR